MDPPPATTFTGRRRSSVTSLDDSPSTGFSPALVAPRKSSIWDDDDDASAPPSHPLGATASDISSRRATAADPSFPPPVGAESGHIAPRKASAWDDDGQDAAVGSGGPRGSASGIAARRATALDRPPWDSFAGAPPGYVGSMWGWVSGIRSITDGTRTPADRNRAFYMGNINYVIQLYNGQSLGTDDLVDIMHAYGVDETTAQNIVNRVDPRKQGSFHMNSSMHQMLRTSNLNFSDPPKHPLTNLRNASKCFQKKLLSPLHFAGYIIDILQGGSFIGNELPFMILGLYGILGVLEDSTNRRLTTKDVETFTSLWKILKPDEAHDLIEMVKEDFNGSISSFDFYNMLYRRNVFGKQRIQMFDLVAPQDPRLFCMLMDKDEDGYLSSSDLQSFASIFGYSLDNTEIRRIISKLDSDGDGKVNFEDFCQTMIPDFDGLTWEFWLPAILLKLEP